MNIRQGCSQLEHTDLAQGSQKQSWLSDQSHCLGSGRHPGTPRDMQTHPAPWGLLVPPQLVEIWEQADWQELRSVSFSAMVINSRATNTWLACGYPKLPSLSGQIFNCCNWAHLWWILLSECENLGQMQQTLRNPNKFSDQSCLILEKNGHLRKTRPRSPELFHSCVQNRNKISSSWAPIPSSLFTVLNHLKSSRITEKQVGPKAHKELRINNRFYYSSWILRLSYYFFS